MNKTHPLLISACIFCAPGNVRGLEVNGIEIAERITQTSSQQPLVLNGVGTRSKFIFDIYVGALYLTEPSNQARQILDSRHAKRISMHFIYDKIEREKMINGWLEGFEENLSEEQLLLLKPKIDAFNSAFTDTIKGDVVVIDFLADATTIVTTNNHEKTRINGANFQRAVLSIWLGEEPADHSLKAAMLGGEQD
jgi:hypothetical protein